MGLVRSYITVLPGIIIGLGPGGPGPISGIGDGMGPPIGPAGIPPPGGPPGIEPGAGGFGVPVTPALKAAAEMHTGNNNATVLTKECND